MVGVMESFGNDSIWAGGSSWVGGGEGRGTYDWRGPFGECVNRFT
jgi:hypothetical protein